MKKKITIIGINFYPEDSAIGLYSSQMCQYLAKSGHEVQVITGFPYYPQWSIYPQYKSKPRFFSERYGDIKIYRYKQYVPKLPKFFSRILHLLDFTLGSFVNVLKAGRADIVICIVPFTSTILLGWLTKLFFGAKLWVHIQDFEFDAAFQTGVSSQNSWIKQILIKMLFGTEKFLLNRADRLSTISFTMLNKLRDKSRVKATYFPNWIDSESINPIVAKEHPFLKSSKIKILYSGNVGDKQDWKLFVDLVTEWQHRKDVEFVIVGNGAKSQWLIESLKLCSNVSLHEPVPFEELSDLLCSADIHILLQKSEVLDTVMPSKLLGMMASGKASIVNGNSNSEVKEVLERSNGGVYLSTNDINELSEALHHLLENREKAMLMGTMARQYVVEHFGKDKILSNFDKQLTRI